MQDLGSVKGLPLWGDCGVKLGLGQIELAS